MHELLEQLDVLEKSANLSASIHDVQNVIELLTAARDKIAAGGCPYRSSHYELRLTMPAQIHKQHR